MRRSIVVVMALALGACSGGQPDPRPAPYAPVETDLAERAEHLAQFWRTNHDSDWTQRFVPLHELTTVPHGASDAVAAATVADGFGEPKGRCPTRPAVGW